MARYIKVGDLVEIKDNAGFHAGDWGKVVYIDKDGDYHVAMFNDENDCPIFLRREIKLMSDNLRDQITESLDDEDTVFTVEGFKDWIKELMEDE